MKARLPDDPSAEPTALDRFLDRLSAGYQRFNVFSSIEDDDSWPLMIGKVFVRILGFLVMLALSPFLLIGLMIAVAAVL